MDRAFPNSLKATLSVLIFGSSLGIIACEAVLIFIGIIPGLVCYAALFLVLINLYIFVNEIREFRTFLFLGLIPLIRILSLVLPVPFIPEISWLSLTGGPVLLTLAVLQRNLRLDLHWLRFAGNKIGYEFAMALTGLPIGLSAYLILKPKTYLTSIHLEILLLEVVGIIIFGAFLEEFLFRGMIPGALSPLIGRSSIFTSTAIYTSLFFGSQSFLYILLVGMISFMYSAWVENNHTIWGVIASHSLWYIGLMVVWPIVFHL